MPRHKRHQLAGWGNYPRAEVSDFRPETTPEIAAILVDSEICSFIGRGLGRSYGDAALNAGGGVIRCERLNRFLDWDEENQVVECEAGVTFADLIDVFLPRGFFPPVTPGTKFVTLGGAVAADVHGKNHHCHGTIASFIESFALQIGTGEVLTCSRMQNADVFWATLGGMGLTGMILSVRLRLLPVDSAFVNVQYERADDLDDALDALNFDRRCRYSVAWIDCLAGGASLGRSVVMRGDHAAAAEVPTKYRRQPLQSPRKRDRSIPCHLPNFTLNRFSVGLFNKLYYRRHNDWDRIVDYDSFFYPLDSIRNWNRIYGKRGFVQYQAVLPHQTSRAGLSQLLKKIGASGQASFLAVLKTFGPANEGLLSFPRAGATLAVDLPNNGQALLDLLDDLDRIVLNQGGRVYLAKDARLTRSAFEDMYPRASAFRELKHRLDPDNRFDSSLARRVGLTAGGDPSLHQTVSEPEAQASGAADSFARAI